MSAESQYTIRQIRPLVGGKIVSTCEDQGFVGIVVVLPNREIKVIWILSDEEGNNPGAVDISSE